MARAAEKYKVVCPVCGKQLFSSSSADVEDVMCPKCKKQYVGKRPMTGRMHFN